MTDVDLSKLLTDLENTARKLNEASNRVNSIILACENKIRAANLGIEIWLEDPLDLSDNQDEDPTNSCRSAKLGFTKVQNNWCLATKIEPGLPAALSTPIGTIVAPIALLQAPRKVRMGAVQLLPFLVEALKMRAKAKLDAIERAAKLVG